MAGTFTGTQGRPPCIPRGGAGLRLRRPGLRPRHGPRCRPGSGLVPGVAAVGEGAFRSQRTKPPAAHHSANRNARRPDSRACTEGTTWRPPPSRPAPTTCRVPHSLVRSHGCRLFQPAHSKRQEPVGPPRDPTRIAPDFHLGEWLMGDSRPRRRQLPNEPRAREHGSLPIQGAPMDCSLRFRIPLRDTTMARAKCR